MPTLDLEQVSDAELVALVRDGHDGAFDALFRRHAGRVAGVCRRRVPAHEVDDVVQDVFLRAHVRLHQLRDGGAVGPWLRSIAVRRCAERHRTRLLTADVDDEVIALHDDALPVDEHLVRQETAAELHRNLQSLSTRDREALWLRDALELPIADIAARFGTTEGSTRVLLTRARRRMKARYVAVVAWLAGLVSASRGRIARLSELSPAAAAGVVAVNAVALAVLLGAGDAPVVVAPAPPTSAQDVDVADDLADTGVATRTDHPASDQASDRDDEVVAAPVPGPDGSSGSVGDVGVRREPPSPHDRTWSVTVEDGDEDPLLGLWVDDHGDDEAEPSDGDDDEEDDQGDGERLVVCVVQLLDGGCGGS